MSRQPLASVLLSAGSNEESPSAANARALACSFTGTNPMSQSRELAGARQGAGILGLSAAWYARHGWPVFPVRPRAKTPLIKAWPKLATTDTDQIARWWREWPEANVGLATGEVYVIDVDQHGIDGEIAFAAAVGRLGELPPTVEQRTGSGGRQLFFSWSHPTIELRNRAGAGGLGEGVDTRGAGGFVVLPPSIHPCGERYRWTSAPHATEIAPLPMAWARRLQANFLIPVPVTRSPFPLPESWVNLRGIIATVENQRPGNRNSALFWAACKIARLHAIGAVTVGPEVLVGPARSSGLTEPEIRRTIASAVRRMAA
jgi:hypothetical protein